jgi:ATP-binding cassette, subfamily C, bacterial LapB
MMTIHDAPISRPTASVDSDDGPARMSLPPLDLLLHVFEAAGYPLAKPALQRAIDLLSPTFVATTTPVEWIRALANHTQLKGVSVLQLGWRRFDQRRLPVLVWMDKTWWLVLGHVPGYQLADESSQVADALLLRNGAGEECTCPDSRLQDALVVWIRPKSVASPLADGRGFLANNPALKLLWAAIFASKGWVGTVMVATVIVNVLAVATSLFAMQVYDRVVPTLAYATLTTLVVGMAIIVLLDWLLKTLRARVLDSMSVAVDKQVSQQVFEHLLYLRLDLQPKSLGTLAAQVGGVESVRQFLTSSVVFGLIDLPFALMFIAFIAVIGGHIAWVYVLLLPVALLLGLVTQWRLRDLLKEQLMRSNERQGILVDAIRGAESIRANHGGWRFAQEWRSVTETIDAYSVQQKAISNVSQVTTGSLSSVAYVAAVVVGVWQIEAGVLTMGAMIACSILGGRVIGPVSQGVQYLTQWQNVRQSLDMVNQVLRLERERGETQTLLMPEDMPQTVSLEKVRYSYPDSPVQQLNIGNLTLRAGERVLVAGAVGCGKSTLLKILAGLYRPAEGRVRLGDADVWEIEPQLLASQIGYLPQSVHLFKGTLRSNLAFSGTAGDSRLLKIARDLGVDTIAAQSAQGMDLPLSEGGEGLSGGQKQLVALARVVINRPMLWLLDEPTASLDAESEARVWRVLAENMRPEDILVVATHRPQQAMKVATRVLVMHQGEIVRDGSPESIVQQVTKARAGEAVKRVTSDQAGGDRV